MLEEYKATITRVAEAKIQLETEDVDQLMQLMSQIQNMDEQSIEQIRDAFEQMGITQAQIDELFEMME